MYIGIPALSDIDDGPEYSVGIYPDERNSIPKNNIYVINIVYSVYIYIYIYIVYIVYIVYSINMQ